MGERSKYRLKIDVFSVDSLPMARLAEYMAELAKLLGEQEHVHFLRLDPGSTVIVSTVDDQSIPKVAERIQQIRESRTDNEVIQAFDKIDNLLVKDNATAALIPPDDSGIIDFPGCTRKKTVRYGPFREHGSLDGVLIRIGGPGEKIPATLRDGDIEYRCYTRVEVGRRMATHLREGTLRVYGSGRWLRSDETWALDHFDIEDFELLDDSSLIQIVDKLRAVEGSAWQNDEALRDAVKLRSDDGDHH